MVLLIICLYQYVYVVYFIPFHWLNVCFFFIVLWQTEQIRRVNRLFAQDSLFLRQYLMIPVDRDTSLQHNQFTKSMSLPVNSEESDFLALAGSSRLGESNASHSPTANASVNDILSPEEESKKSIEDFLGKIDSNLAKTKKYVKTR